jgi:hypothetical protein
MTRILRIPAAVKLCYRQRSLQRISHSSDSHRKEQHRYPCFSEAQHRVRYQAKNYSHFSNRRGLGRRYAGKMPGQQRVIDIKYGPYLTDSSSTYVCALYCGLTKICKQVLSATSPSSSTPTVEILLTPSGRLGIVCSHRRPWSLELILFFSETPNAILASEQWDTSKDTRISHKHCTSAISSR